MPSDFLNSRQELKSELLFLELLKHIQVIFNIYDVPKHIQF